MLWREGEMSRVLIVIIAPIAMVVGFASVLIRDIGRAFIHAWLEARIELEAARRDWHR
jgi:hypothetical protein